MPSASTNKTRYVRFTDDFIYLTPRLTMLQVNPLTAAISRSGNHRIFQFGNWFIQTFHSMLTRSKSAFLRMRMPSLLLWTGAKSLTTKTSTTISEQGEPSSPDRTNSIKRSNYSRDEESVNNVVTCLIKACCDSIWMPTALPGTREIVSIPDTNVRLGRQKHL